MVPGRPYSDSFDKAAASSSAALMGGTAENSNTNPNPSFTKMLSAFRTQALTSNIRRLKQNIKHHEKRKQAILSELKKMESPLSEDMIGKQENLEMLLKKDKKHQHCRWVAYRRRQLTNKGSSTPKSKM